MFDYIKEQKQKVLKEHDKSFKFKVKIAGTKNSTHYINITEKQVDQIFNILENNQ